MTPGALVSSPECRGIACVYLGPALERRHPEICDDDGNPTGEFDMTEIEDVELDGRARIRMVGDDYVFHVDVDTLTPITEPLCECGQIGCGWHGQPSEAA